MILTVQKAASEDVYRDIARVPEAYRKTSSGNTITEGSVCKISVRAICSYALLRGCKDSDQAIICLDERKRNELGLNPGETIDIDLAKVGIWGEFCWSWRASDPAYRISARLGVVSLLLGSIGLVLGVAGIVLGILGLRK